VDPEIKKLLVLQEEDAKKIEAERQLAALPREVSAIEKKIADELALQTAENNKLKEKEALRTAMRTERIAAEAQIVKYKTQQMQVKKNEEYTALTHEIQRMVDQVSEREGAEIALLMEIDEVTKTVNELNKTSVERVAELKKQMQLLRDGEKKLQADIKSLTISVETLAKEIKPKYMRAYDNVKLRYKRPPFVVPVIDRKAQGLRVSGECESAIRKATDVVTDENSGRIVYLP